MPIELSHIRDLLLPGLWEITAIGGRPLFVASRPHIWVPKISLPEAVALGAAAAIIKNPEVTRRFWSGWTS